MSFFCCCFWIIGRDEVQQREKKNDVCTLYTHTFLLIQPTHTHRHTLSLTHKHNAYKEKQL